MTTPMALGSGSLFVTASSPIRLISTWWIVARDRREHRPGARCRPVRTSISLFPVTSRPAFPLSDRPAIPVQTGTGKETP